MGTLHVGETDFEASLVLAFGTRKIVGLHPGCIENELSALNLGLVAGSKCQIQLILCHLTTVTLWQSLLAVASIVKCDRILFFLSAEHRPCNRLRLMQGISLDVLI